MYLISNLKLLLWVNPNHLFHAFVEVPTRLDDLIVDDMGELPLNVIHDPFRLVCHCHSGPPLLFHSHD